MNRLCIIMLVLSLCYDVASQDYTFTQYTTEDGLPTNYVYGAVEDDLGFIWFFTEKGLSKFDGRSFTNYSVENGLLENDVYQMWKDPTGTLWVESFSEQPQYIENDSIHTWRSNKKFVHFDVRGDQAMARDKDSTYFIYSQDSLEVKLTGTLYPYTKTHEKSGGYLFEKSNRYLYMKGKTLHSEDLGTKTTTRLGSFTNLIFDKSLSYCDSSALILNKDSIFYLFNLFKEGKDSINLQKLFRHKINFYNPAQLLEENFYIGMDVGMVELSQDLDPVQSIEYPEYITDLSPRGAFIDSHGNLWVCTRNGGVFLLSREKMRTSTIASTNFHKSGIRHVRQDSASLYVLDNNATVYKMKNGMPQRLYNSAKYGLRFSAMHKGDLWFTHVNNGTKIISPDGTLKSIHFPILEEFRLYPSDSSLTKWYQIHFTKDKVWAELHGERYFSINYPVIDSIHFYDFGFNSVIEHDEKIFLGCEDGLFHYENNERKRLSEITFVNHIKPVANNVLLCVTADKGLFEYHIDENRVRAVHKSPFLGEIVSGEKDEYFLASNKGVLHIYCPEGENCRVIYSYDQKDGLPDNDIPSVAYKDKVLTTASIQGLSLIKVMNPNDAIKRSRDTAAVISWCNTCTGSYSQSESISFDIQYIDFASEGDILYEYQILPIHDSWIQAESPHIDITGIGSGKYEMQARVIDAFGNLHYATASKFEVKMPFWRQALFWVPVTLMLVMAVLFGINYRKRRQAEKKNQIQDIQNKIQGIQIDSLKTQLNPHFIFNTLSAIQYLILSDDRDRADEYLSQFSGLLRDYISDADKQAIPLEKLVQTIEKYVNFEELRTENTIHFETDLDLDTYSELLPAMLLQTPIELALQRISKKNTTGNIKLKASIIMETLVILISDDGDQSTKLSISSNDLTVVGSRDNWVDRIESLNTSVYDIVYREYKDELKNILELKVKQNEEA